MNKTLAKQRLSNKQKLDIATMQYFIPTASKCRVSPNDKKKMANLSSQGIEPVVRTPGFKALTIGRMYRDWHVTSYRDDVRKGLITKAELTQSMPAKLQPWLTSKLAQVPYDESGETTSMFLAIHRGSAK